MKILLLNDASNCHRALAAGLRRLGCEVTLMSSGGGFMQTERDIDISRRFPGPAGGLDLWLRLNTVLAPKLKGYDVVSCTNPVMVELKPTRNRQLFNLLKRNNRGVFLTALGTDLPWIEECLDPQGKMRYNEFRLSGAPGPLALERPEIIRAWQTSPLSDWTNEFYERIDGAVTVLYEYNLSVARRLSPEKFAYGGIPVDLSAQIPVELPDEPSPVRIFLGRHSHRMAEKGTDRLEEAARRAIRRHPGKGELIIVENVTYAEYLRQLKSAHLVIDQAYSFTPATNALLAMGYGIPVVSGGEPEFYDFIGQPRTPEITPPSIGRDGTGFTPGTFDPLRPVINTPVDVDGMTAMFEYILEHPGILRPLGEASRRFVERHNACETVASRFLEFWRSRLG